tara:strand:- start:48 stop:1244 length:1197 start_codon:yes stop_codon:yes gene_type:complete
MAATEKGVWDLQDVRDKQLASEWTYDAVDPGTMWSWGMNAAPSSRGGWLGHNNTTDYSSPTQVGTDTTWMNVCFTGSSAIAAKVGNTLWTCGYNLYGGLGQNNTTSYSSPTQVGTDTTWGTQARQIAGSGNNTYQIMGAIKTDGTLWTWGRGTNGPLAHNNQTNYSSPRQVPGTTWSKIAMASYHSGAIKTDGTLWAWGINEGGELGQNNVIEYSSPVQVGTATDWSDIHLMSNNYGYGNIRALKTDGTLWNWGYGQFGANGVNDNANYSSPMQIPGTWSSLPLNNGWSRSHRLQAAINTDGELFVWGGNSTGSLGLSDNTYRSSPTQLPGSWESITTAQGGVAIRTDGTLWAWGHNGYGTLGQNTTPNFASPKQVGTDTDWMRVSAGEYSVTGSQES